MGAVMICTTIPYCSALRLDMSRLIFAIDVCIMLVRCEDDVGGVMATRCHPTLVVQQLCGLLNLAVQALYQLPSDLLTFLRTLVSCGTQRRARSSPRVMVSCEIQQVHYRLLIASRKRSERRLRSRDVVCLGKLILPVAWHR